MLITSPSGLHRVTGSPGHRVSSGHCFGPGHRVTHLTRSTKQINSVTSQTWNFRKIIFVTTYFCHNYEIFLKICKIFLESVRLLNISRKPCPKWMMKSVEKCRLFVDCRRRARNGLKNLFTRVSLVDLLVM